MFDKQRSILPKEEKKKVPQNIFEKEQYKESISIASENGALKYSTSGNIFVDDFATIGNYLKPRNIKDVFEDMERFWKEDKKMCLRMIGYIRLITREPKLFDGTKLPTQRGQGLRTEYYYRMLWLAVNHPVQFKKNLATFIAIGSWNDIFEMMVIDLSYVHDGNPSKRVLDWEFLVEFIQNGLNDESQRSLICKYLPTIKSKSTIGKQPTLRRYCLNRIGGYIASKMFPNMKIEEARNVYRKLKSSGTAHVWQKLISQQKYSEIDFSTIAGKALNLLVNKSKFLSNHNLEDKYIKWLEKQPLVKFNGYPYELFKGFRYFTHDERYFHTYPEPNKYQELTINKQFMHLVQNANCNSNFIVALDTSGSMSNECANGLSAITVAKSMALYFSYILKGKFANTFLEFEDTCNIKSFNGETPMEKWRTMVGEHWGSTNFLSVAKCFVNLKKKGYDESEFPTGVLCISDGEWNYEVSREKTNFEGFKGILRMGGFSDEYVDNFKIVLWDIYRGQSPKFETLAGESNFFIMSGFDGSGISFIFGEPEKQKSAPKTPEELLNIALSQEILELLKL